MRQKRAKAYRRLLHHYVLHYQFREPYQVLIDPTFAEALVRFQVHEPLKQLGSVLHGKVKPMITQCCIAALYDAENHARNELQNSDEQQTYKQAIALAKTWERRKCNHKETQTAGACIASVIGEKNQHRYMLAADDVQVRRSLRRSVPGLPIVHYSQSVLVLEPMSDVTERHITHMEQSKSALSIEEQRILQTPAFSPASTNANAPSQPVAPKRKRAKGPNPLSVKKSKSASKSGGKAGGLSEGSAPSKSHATPAVRSDTSSQSFVSSISHPTSQRRRNKKRGRGSHSTVQ